MYSDNNTNRFPSASPSSLESEFSPVKEAEEIMDTPTVAEETAEANESEIKIGTVADCHSLNVRKEPAPDAEVLCTIPNSIEVMIEESESTDDFYKVCTASGVEGYCMKKYIAVQQ